MEGLTRIAMATDVTTVKIGQNLTDLLDREINWVAIATLSRMTPNPFIDQYIRLLSNCAICA